MLPRGLSARILLMTISLVGCSAIEHKSSPIAAEPSVALRASDAAALAPAPVQASDPVPDEERSAKKLFSLRRHVWIRERPSSGSAWIGFLGLGGAVQVRGQPVRGDGCDAFYAVEPRGFVCLDDKTTLDPASPARLAVQHLAPRTEEAFLHDYGDAREAPRYWSVPTIAQQRRREFALDRHLHLVDELRDGTLQDDIPPLLRGVDVTRAGAGPPDWLAALPVVHEFRALAPAGSAVSYSASFDAEGRTWLVTGDGALIPKDKVAPFPRSAFHGVTLDDDVVLPIAFAREKDSPLYARHPDGALVAAGAPLSRLAWTRLTGDVVQAGRHKYLQTSEQRLWVDERDVVVVRASPVTPWGERVDAPNPAAAVRWPARLTPPPPGPRATWIEASVHEGWLIAYEGARPVYATLAASGRGDEVGRSGFVQTSTATGVFSIQGKYWTETMDIGATVHFDVPFTMPYHNSYAIHAAYWHDRWGEKVSLGCLNLSPLDARWLFLWSEPQIPEGWHGMTSRGAGSPATVVVVHG